jgi:hypothetical protein
MVQLARQNSASMVERRSNVCLPRLAAASSRVIRMRSMLISWCGLSGSTPSSRAHSWAVKNWW